MEEEIPELKVYVAHSGNATHTAKNEYDAFYTLKPKDINDKKKINAILLNVNIISEGCDIDFVDCGIFLDPVKNKNIVTYLQNAGRICRTDIYRRKTSANIIYTYLSEKKDIPSQIIKYFEMLLQLTEKNNDYYNKMNELLGNLKVKNKEIRIVIDTKENHDCVMYLDREIKDFAKIKKDISKIKDRQFNYKKENELGDLEVIKKYDFTKSKIQKSIFDNELTKLKNYNPIFEHLYKIINDSKRILEITSLNIVNGCRVDRGFKYIENLNISVQNVDANKAIYEIFNLSYRIKKNMVIEIILDNGKNIVVSYTNDKIEVTEISNDEKDKLIIAENNNHKLNKDLDIVTNELYEKYKNCKFTKSNNDKIIVKGRKQQKKTEEELEAELEL